MLDGLEKYIGDPSKICATAALEIGKFAIMSIYNSLTSPKAKAVDAFVLGYYLPWLSLAKGLDDTVFSKDPEAFSEKSTLEFYVFDAAINLGLNIDRDYVYNVKCNALVERRALSKLISGKDGETEKELNAYNLGFLLSDSIIIFEDLEARNKSIEEARVFASKFELASDADRLLASLLGNRDDKPRYISNVETFAGGFIKSF